MANIELNTTGVPTETAPDFAADRAWFNDVSETPDAVNQALLWRFSNQKGADIASASTVVLDNATGDCVDVTGTTTVTAVTLAEGREVLVRFTGILTLTHGASLVLPTAANITTAAGDFAVFRGYAAGVVRCAIYQRASGAALAGSGGASIGGGSGTTDTMVKFTNTTEIDDAPGVTQASGKTLVLTSQAATDEPLRIVSAASQSGDLIEATASDGTTMHFNVTAGGVVLAKQGAFYSSTIFGVIGQTTTGLASNGDYVTLSNQGQALLSTRYNGGSSQHVALMAAAPLVWSASGGAVDATADAGIKRIGPNLVGTTDSSAGATLGVVPGVAFVQATSDFTLSAASGAQNAFTGANDTLTVKANTSYFFEAEYFMTTGTTTHTTATLFGGTATYTGVNYWAELWSNTDGTISTTAPSVLRVAVATSTVLNATSTAAGTVIRLKGIIRTNAAGTLIPQINFSANPGGTNLMKAGSYFKLWAAGLDTTASAGQWA